MKERIQKVLAHAGLDSRRKVEEMVRQGRVKVNGRLVTQLPVMVDPAVDEITVDEERVKPPRPARGVQANPKHSDRAYVLLNKPRGVYSTNVAQGAQVRAIDLLPESFGKRVYPVGRLDAESRGLLLLTDDGDLTHRLTHPRFGVAKTYRVVVDGRVDPDGMQKLEHGVWLADPRTGGGFKTGRTRIKVVKRGRDRSVLEITLQEGRNRQVRRMLARVGHKVRDPTRIKMGPLTLDGLNPGQSRLLTAREVRALRAMVDRQEAKESDPAERGESKNVEAAADRRVAATKGRRSHGRHSERSESSAHL